MALSTCTQLCTLLSSAPELYPLTLKLWVIKWIPFSLVPPSPAAPSLWLCGWDASCSVTAITLLWWSQWVKTWGSALSKANEVYMFPGQLLAYSAHEHGFQWLVLSSRFDCISLRLSLEIESHSSWAAKAGRAEPGIGQGVTGGHGRKR